MPFQLVMHSINEVIGTVSGIFSSKLTSLTKASMDYLPYFNIYPNWFTIRSYNYLCLLFCGCIPLLKVQAATEEGVLCKEQLPGIANTSKVYTPHTLFLQEQNGNQIEIQCCLQRWTVKDVSDYYAKKILKEPNAWPAVKLTTHEGKHLSVYKAQPLIKYPCTDGATLYVVYKGDTVYIENRPIQVDLRFTQLRDIRQRCAPGNLYYKSTLLPPNEDNALLASYGIKNHHVLTWEQDTTSCLDKHGIYLTVSTWTTLSSRKIGVLLVTLVGVVLCYYKVYALLRKQHGAKR